MVVLDVPTADAFERDVIRAADPTVVMFWASWCPFCRAFRPAFEARADGSEARFARVSLDDYDNPLWETYDVRVVPTLAYVRDGTLVARRDGILMRGLSPRDLDAFLASVLPAQSPSR